MHANASLAESLALLPEQERLEALAELSRAEIAHYATMRAEGLILIIGKRSNASRR